MAPLAAALFLAAACSVTDSTAPMRDGRIAAPIADMVPFEPTPEEVEVCKLYEPGVNGPTVTFDWAIDDSANGSINATGSVNVAPGECVVLPPAGTRTHEHLVYVQERVPVGFYSTYIAKEYHMGVVTVGNTVVADTATAYMHGDRGWALIFTNNVARGTLGCSHGYWKVEQHWDSWPAPYGP
ncbi:MAG TPA: hypothetical protein VFV33_16030, partial [Gemmatimonadaceae bacterium]|nr:hypothetical protein [Gemmatimonadaceae bacterium]